ncbi:MAG: sigma-54 dependent transcriptional regulator [Candidatus Acidiferrales bacterium]
MSDQTVHVSFVSQDFGLAEAIARALGDGFVARATNELQLSRLNEVREWCDVMLLDLRDASTQGEYQTGLRLMDELNKISSHPPVVVLCDGENRSLLLNVMERGAYDSVTNPPDMIELRLILRRAYKFHAAEKELEGLRASTRGSGRLHELLGTSPGMQELFALAQKIAPCDVNVLITGETGTGKELLARAIHQMSGRNARPLVAFSCANLPETLIEDELFGHEKGAFTGALTLRRGRLETADHGTLFLDEIGDLSLGLQPKLLRVLQERSFERLGSNGTINVNIRLICATNRNLAEMVQQSKFREDLYYRLNVVQMHLPPLRERRDDIPLLAQHFLQDSAQQFKKKAKRFSQPALHALEEYGWPGNVRELVNAVQRAVVLSEGHSVDIWQLPAAIRSGCDGPQFVRSYEEEVRQFKRRLVLRTLRECGWRKAESARTLGVARGYLHRLINQLGIQQEGEDSSPEKSEEFPPVRQVM